MKTETRANRLKNISFTQKKEISDKRTFIRSIENVVLEFDNLRNNGFNTKDKLEVEKLENAYGDIIAILAAVKKAG